MELLFFQFVFAARGWETVVCRCSSNPRQDKAKGQVGVTLIVSVQGWIVTVTMWTISISPPLSPYFGGDAMRHGCLSPHLPMCKKTKTKTKTKTPVDLNRLAQTVWTVCLYQQYVWETMSFGISRHVGTQHHCGVGLSFAPFSPGCSSHTQSSTRSHVPGTLLCFPGTKIVAF